MRKFHRAVHFDFHNMPGIYDINRDFDAAVFAQRLADAHVDYINFFTQCNRGFAYYPTKVGIPYPGAEKGSLRGYPSGMPRPGYRRYSIYQCRSDARAAAAPSPLEPYGQRGKDPPGSGEQSQLLPDTVLQSAGIP